MKKIKVKFINLWGKFDENDNFIINILRKKYIVELSDNPDYLFFSGFNSNIYKYKCIRIFFAFENFVPDFNLCDYAIGFNYINFEDRYIRYPLYLVNDFSYYKGDNYKNDMEMASMKHLVSNSEISKKKKFCSFVVSSKVDEKRNYFFEQLSKYKKVDSGGRYKNNVGGPVEDKLKFQSDYKFAIAFENSSSSGYTTEKLMQAFAAKTVPIYYGSKRIEEEFNPKAFINCAKFKNFDDVIKKIIEIDNNDELYESMLKEPAVLNEQNLMEKKDELENFIFNIIDQEKNEAFRRNKSDYGNKYEKKMRLANEIYVFLLNIKIKFSKVLLKEKI